MSSSFLRDECLLMHINKFVQDHHEKLFSIFYCDLVEKSSVCSSFTCVTLFKILINFKRFRKIEKGFLMIELKIDFFSSKKVFTY
jgi:hypothetical protein